ncbi:hypothetical protein SD70_11475 [Gordoniibacillus kamchatkensis]|uniref:Exopolyphosphatase n=1 Tax=Gordoniibacillus kamchatkensis TaxID=1590651 RepID=A0ABR5AID3_9BACL|nr:Ppx/GppA phosphatase family protein [Paenibacillus sp. VKM B-2647]KIL40700.1 hypothetical protein SD70_11475 [Paenibacillus sp. VKM B-2647]
MTKKIRRIGIIDIGSNSIRLVIYEHDDRGAHRILGEWKESARLSERIGTDGMLREADILAVAQVLLHFRGICETYGAATIRAAATAAVRSAANSAEVANSLRRRTGLAIEVLSGEEEARLGFLGVINTMSVRDGFLVDIGGGSTEVSLFKERRLLHSVSFPFGAVNTCRAFTRSGELDAGQQQAVKAMIEQAAAAHPWLFTSPGLPLIGLGGTVRTLGKLDQRRRKYPFAQAHNYRVPAESVDELSAALAAMPVAKRKKIDGMPKERADIIAPGLLILQTLFRLIGAAEYVVSGAGLRDGLFYETVAPHRPVADDVLESSVNNLLALHAFMPEAHIRQVERLALKLFDDLRPLHGLSAAHRSYLSVAARLYRLGAAVHYYQYHRHTFYMVAYSRLDGLSHREILLCALIAAHKTKNRTRQTLQPYRDIMTESDESLAAKLGTLLQLAVALDRSETQPVEAVEAEAAADAVRIRLRSREQPLLELKEAASVDKEFQKAWNMRLEFSSEAFSTN